MALRSLNSSCIIERRINAAPKKSVKKISLPSTGPNDENLDIVRLGGGGNKIVPPLPGLSESQNHNNNASSLGASCPMAADLHGSNTLDELALPDVEYVLSEELKPLDNDDANVKLETLLSRLDSKDWVTVFEALNQMRQFSIYHSAALLQFLDAIVSLVNKAMKNPRSALCKTAIMASTDLFRAYQDGMLAILDPLLLQLLLKASQDKRFVCEEAERALETMTTCLSPAPLMQKLQPYVIHRNPRVRAKTAACTYRCVSKLGLEGIKAYGFDSLMQIASAQLNDQLPEAREAARKLVIDLHSAYLKQILDADLTEEQNINPSDQDAWEQFCCSQLSSNVAQAVLRLTSAAC
eukprot:c8941_g1_i1 orf=623-1678(-)